MLKGSKQQAVAGSKQAGVAPESSEDDEAMPEAAPEEAEGPDAAEQEREQAAGSYVASLLQQTSLADSPGEALPLMMLLPILLPALPWRDRNPAEMPRNSSGFPQTRNMHSFSRQLIQCLNGVSGSAIDTAPVVAEDEGAQLRGLTPEEAAQLRAQMEDLLKGADQARAAIAGDEAGMRYGREMWARCEALTAGAVPAPLACPRISCGMLLPGLDLTSADIQSVQCTFP